MDRFWLLTWTTYGTWLPGDRRGFVSNVRTCNDSGERHNTPRTAYDADMPLLRVHMQERLVGEPIYLSQEQATELLAQFHETATFRKWSLLAVAIMANHTHLVVGVPGDPDPAELLGDFKSYGSRRLNRRWGKPASGTWWTESGSRRKLPDKRAVAAATGYVADQAKPLVVWIPTVDPGERGT